MSDREGPLGEVRLGKTMKIIKAPSMRRASSLCLVESTEMPPEGLFQVLFHGIMTNHCCHQGAKHSFILIVVLFACLGMTGCAETPLSGSWRSVTKAH